MRPHLETLSLLLLCSTSCPELLPFSSTSEDSSIHDGARRDRPAGQADRTTRDGIGAVELILTLASPVDDGEAEAGDWWPDGETGSLPGLFMGYWFIEATWAYFTFWNNQTPISAGSTVCAAHLELNRNTTDGDWGQPATEHALRVYLESSTALTPVAARQEPLAAGGRPVLPSSVRWPATGALSWPSGGVARSEDLGGLIRSLLGSKGLAKGQGLRFWITGDFSLGEAAEAATYDVSDPRYAGLSAKNQLRITLCP